MAADKQSSPERLGQFKRVARELGCDESEAAFDDKLRQIARHTPRPATPDSKAKPE
jgi:hypothetical protein